MAQRNAHCSFCRKNCHAEQPVTPEALVAAGARPDWAGHLATIAHVAPLDEGTLSRIVPCVDFSQVESGPALDSLDGAPQTE
jgi:hypothetical protein